MRIRAMTTRATTTVSTRASTVPTIWTSIGHRRCRLGHRCLGWRSVSPPSDFDSRQHGVTSGRGIATYGDLVAADVGDHGLLTSEEFTRLIVKYMPVPIERQLVGYGLVRLRMAHGVYPYVGVDFSDSEHALFDPRMMICWYSD